MPAPDRLALFEASLEAVAARAGDPTEAVYRALFAALPHTEPLFARDTDRSIQGHMLLHVLDCLRDIAGTGAYGAQMVRNEAVTHGEVGVTPADFPRFFAIVHATLRSLASPAWTPAMDTVWSDLIAEAVEALSPAHTP